MCPQLTGNGSLFALLFGVPFVFCSGDAYACREIEELIPGCVTVPVKTGLSRKSALTLTPAKAQQAIREGAEEAMSRIGQVKPFKLDTPVVFREERALNWDEIESRLVDNLEVLKPTFGPNLKPRPAKAICEITARARITMIFFMGYKVN